MEGMTAKLWDDGKKIYREQKVITENGIDWDKFIQTLLGRQAVDGRRRVLDYLIDEGVLTILKDGSYFFMGQYNSSKDILGYHFVKEDDAKAYFHNVRSQEELADIKEKSLIGIVRMVTDVSNT